MQGPQLWLDSIHRLKLSLISTLPAPQPATISPLTLTWVKANKSKPPLSVFTLPTFTWGSCTQIRSFSRPDPNIEGNLFKQRIYICTYIFISPFPPHDSVVVFSTSKDVTAVTYLPIQSWIIQKLKQGTKSGCDVWFGTSSKFLDRSSHAKNLEHQQGNEALVRGWGLFHSFPLISVSNSKVLVVFFPLVFLGKQQQCRKSDKRINCGANLVLKWYL